MEGGAVCVTTWSHGQGSSFEELLHFNSELTETFVERAIGFCLDGRVQGAEPIATLENSWKHCREVFEYLEMGVNDIVYSVCLLRRVYKLRGDDIKTYLEASELLHVSVYVQQAVMQDINVRKSFWRHVSAKPFHRFYFDVMNFCKELGWHTSIGPAEFNLEAQSLLQAAGVNTPSACLTPTLPSPTTASDTDTASEAPTETFAAITVRSDRACSAAVPTVSDRGTGPRAGNKLLDASERQAVAEMPELPEAGDTDLVAAGRTIKRRPSIEKVLSWTPQPFSNHSRRTSKQEKHDKLQREPNTVAELLLGQTKQPLMGWVKPFVKNVSLNVALAKVKRELSRSPNAQNHMQHRVNSNAAR